MIDTTFGKRVITKSVDSTNEYVKRVMTINAVLSIDVKTSFCISTNKTRIIKMYLYITESSDQKKNIVCNKVYLNYLIKIITFLFE